MRLYSRIVLRALAILFLLAPIAEDALAIIPAGLPSGLSLTIEPMVGFEKAYKLYPDLHYTQRFMYGVRAIAGYSILSAEAEMSRTNDSESFVLPEVTYLEKADKLKVGLRTAYVLASLIDAHLRAGGQATQATKDVIVGGNTTSSAKEKIKISPYAGVGIRIAVGLLLSLTADCTIVVNQVNDFRRSDIQYTVGMAVSL